MQQRILFPFSFFLFPSLLVVLGCGPAEKSIPSVLEWQELPALPDEYGFAGPFVGVSENALLVAGGANFPGDKPDAQVAKVWHDDIYLLPEPGGKWRTLDQKLPRPLAYGVALTWNDRVLCFGGSDSSKHYSDAFALRWDGTKGRVEKLPSLPKPMAMGAGVLIDDTVYLAAGSEAPDSKKASSAFWSLDLAAEGEERKWVELPTWPGPERILPQMAAFEGSVYLISGAKLILGDEDKVRREFLTDVYRFDPKSKTWERRADAPRPIVAAPSPAMTGNAFHILTLSGDDGSLFGKKLDKHPGFPKQIYAYNTVTDRWSHVADFPKKVADDVGPLDNEGTWPPVTTSTTVWNGKTILASGEARPRVRSPKVYAVSFASDESAFGWVNMVVLVAYLVLLVVIGFVFSRRMKTTDDYFLAGGRIPWWAAGLSIFSTQLSAITYLALPARSFATDWSQFLYNAGILLVTPVVIACYLPLYRKMEGASVYEYLEQRFNKGLRILGSVSFIIYQIGRVGVIVLLPALALSAVTGLNLYLSLLVMGVLSTLYTVLGGIEAVIWTDVLQTIVLLGGGLAAVAIMAAGIGGLGPLFSEASAQGKLTVVHWSWDLTTDSLFVLAFAMVAGNLVPYTSDQAVVQRYLTTSDEGRTRRAIWTNALLSIPATLLFLSIGSALFVFYQHHAADLTPIQKADQVFPLFIARQMPVGLAGLVIAGVFAAAMSSIDSSIHSVATVITTGMKRNVLLGATEERTLATARTITVVLGVLGTAAAMVMANFEIRYLWDFFLALIGMVMGTVAGVFALGVFVPRARPRDAWVGLTLSVGIILYCKFLTPISGLLFSVIGLGGTLLFGYLSSLISGEEPTGPPTEVSAPAR